MFKPASCLQLCYPFFASLAEHLKAQSRKSCLRLPWLSPKFLSFFMKFEATAMRSSC